MEGFVVGIDVGTKRNGVAVLKVKPSVFPLGNWMRHGLENVRMFTQLHTAEVLPPSEFHRLIESIIKEADSSCGRDKVLFGVEIFNPYGRTPTDVLKASALLGVTIASLLQYVPKEQIWGIPRVAVKSYLCGTPRAKDKDVRDVLKSYLPAEWFRVKVKADAWQALGIAVLMFCEGENLVQRYEASQDVVRLVASAFPSTYQREIDQAAELRKLIEEVYEDGGDTLESSSASKE